MSSPVSVKLGAAEILTSPVGSIRRLITTHQDVVLTFDDGPDPDSTPGVLDALCESGGSATFFVLLTRARTHPHLVRRAIAEGHEVALHGWDHARLTQYSGVNLAADLKNARDELEEIAGVPIRWFRPPFGAQSLRTWRATRAAGMQPVMWSHTTSDTRSVNDQQRIESTIAGLFPGCILLAHDSMATSKDNAEDASLLSLDRPAFVTEILQQMGLAGYQVRSMGDALGRGARIKKSAWFGG